MTPGSPSRSTFDGRLPLVIVTSSFPIKGDGSEAAGSFVADLAEELATRVPVRVVAPGPVAKREAWNGMVDVFRYAAPAQALSTLKPWRPGDAKWIARVLRGGLEATRNATEDGASHLLALWALPCGEWARRVSRETGIPYSVWTLGSDIWTLGKMPLLRTLLRHVLREADTCYSDGLKLADDTRRIAGREVEFLPSTRRTERHRTLPVRSEPPYRLLFLGRWHPNKGVDLLLDALDLLDDADWQRIENVRICGGGPLESVVHSRASALRDRGRPVDVTGYLDKATAEEAILDADWLLIPSRIESIPVVFSDAMKLGCPVIAMPTGDLPTLLREAPTCGVLAKRIAPTSFAAAIAFALNQPPSGYVTGTALRARRFDLDCTTKLITDAITTHDA